MFNINFKKHYKVLHVTNEIGEYLIGGLGTFINEMYSKHTDAVGFLHIYSQDEYPEVAVAKYPGDKDILALEISEATKIDTLDFEIMVIHFFNLVDCITEETVKQKKIIYVAHSVPLPEPPPKYDPFGGNIEIEQKFNYLCHVADKIICVSEAEKSRLFGIYPECEDKIEVIHNGITIPKNVENISVNKNRNKFGYIGRTDYRKGILDCVKVFKLRKCELLIACPRNDAEYLVELFEYIDAADLHNRIKFCGFCIGERKVNFFKSVDAVIIPSLYEPFGYVIVEAIQAGVPVITSNNGGLGEVVGKYKYQYYPYDELGLSKVLDKFIEDDSSVVEKEMQYLSKRLQTFSVDNMYKKYQRVWDSM